eukprot:TRINITY_DN40690_c0_g1_i1.p1 TRINITY_DN40690_c0_g1~~TRINITY_DN40690_c0_g1_i1.p1  ORF type:complete len:703 (-),score=134.03 TRINITY_DN40690_c0_g1_i1:93-2138(-)
MVMEPSALTWHREPTPLCLEDAAGPVVSSLLGHCSTTPPPRAVVLRAAGPLEPMPPDGVTLCTHITAAALGRLEPMLRAWGGAASVAVLDDGSGGVQIGLDGLRAWLGGLATAAPDGDDRGGGLRRIVASLVGGYSRPSSSYYDAAYPANVLRRAALEAAEGELVLLADPFFLPSAGFLDALAATTALGRSVRQLLSSPAPAPALLVASFLLFEDEGSTGSSHRPGELTLDDLREHVENGSASAFDAHVCPLCRPHAWQWLFLAGSMLTFREVEPHDLHHPAWLMKRTAVPRFPRYLHGLVSPNSGYQKMGWTGLPCGLRASAEVLRARGSRMLLLPGLFLYRHAAEPPPEGIQELPGPMGFLYDLAFRRFLVSAKRGRGNGTQSGPLVAQAVLAETQNQVLAEVLPPPTGDSLLTLKVGHDTSMHLVLMASIVVGSEDLRRLLASVPWTVHAMAVGVKDYWTAAKRDLPGVLLTLGADTLVAIVDAYDMVLLPCDRNVTEEYLSYGKPIVMSAEKTCWPVSRLCRRCDERYAVNSSELSECAAFPNVNGGALMGTASALAEALAWMHEQGPGIGRDDQENKWHLYNHLLPLGRVALDHGQRIWSQFFGCEPEKFRLQGCRVVNDYTGREVCFAHGNGGTKWEILQPLLRRLEEAGCRKPAPKPRSSRAYAGMATPPMIWS